MAEACDTLVVGLGRPLRTAPALHALAVQETVWTGATSGGDDVSVHLEEAPSKARDPHLNYVLQLCVILSSAEQFAALCLRLRGFAVSTAVHRYGCRVMARIVEQYAPSEAARELLLELEPALPRLARHRYATYVVQALLTHLPSFPGLTACVEGCVEKPTARGALEVILVASRLGLLAEHHRTRLTHPQELERLEVQGEMGQQLARELSQACSSAHARAVPVPIAFTGYHLPCLAQSDSGAEHVVYCPVWCAVSTDCLSWTAQLEELKDVVVRGRHSLHLGVMAYGPWNFGLDLLLDRSEASEGGDKDHGPQQARLRRLLKLRGPLHAASPRLKVDAEVHDFGACQVCSLSPCVVDLAQERFLFEVSLSAACE